MEKPFDNLSAISTKMCQNMSSEILITPNTLLKLETSSVAQTIRKLDYDQSNCKLQVYYMTTKTKFNLI